MSRFWINLFVTRSVVQKLYRAFHGPIVEHSFSLEWCDKAIFLKWQLACLICLLCGELVLASFSMVGLLISINYKSGLFGMVVSIFFHHHPFQNGISQLLEEAKASNAHCWKGERKTKTLIKSRSSKNEYSLCYIYSYGQDWKLLAFTKNCISHPRIVLK